MIDYLAVEINRLQAEIEKQKSLLTDPEIGILAKEEIKKLKTQIKSLQNTKNSSSEQETNSNSSIHNSIIIEIRPAAGGDEAKNFASDLTRMYLKFAENLGFTASLLDEHILRISGKPKKNPNWQLTPFQTFQFESGVHRVQRVPATESSGRIHTSTATIAVLPIIPPQTINIKPTDLEWQFTKSGGPGGQNVNKVNSAVRLTHIPTGINISVRQERSQVKNKEIALEMLRSQLYQNQQDKIQTNLQKERSQAVGTGDRSEKIKTYNFPQNRLTDHRINQSWYQLSSIVEGNLEKVIKETKSKLKNSSFSK